MAIVMIGATACLPEFVCLCVARERASCLHLMRKPSFLSRLLQVLLDLDLRVHRAMCLGRLHLALSLHPVRRASVASGWLGEE